MNEHEAQRFLNEQRYQAELPFPVSAVFTHYARSSSKNYALRSLQLVATAQSTIRYAAIAAACDYSTNPDADESVLNWLRQEWLGGKKPSFGTWYGALMRLLAESGKSLRNSFVPEFTEIDRELLEKKIQPLIHGRNVEIGHAEYYEALALKHFVELQEENLFAVMEQFSFLARYPLAFAEVEDDYEPPAPGTKQAVNICRGSSHNFARYTVAPSHPLTPGIPFIWNPEYTGILTLSPFLIYGRATTDAEQKEKVKGVAHIQGLMVLNGVPKGSPVYTSVDAEAQFSLDSFEFPPKEKIQQQVDSALKKGLDVPARKETRLTEEEKELFVRTTDFVAPALEKERVPLKKKKLPLKGILISTVLGVMVLVGGFALYSRFMAPKAPATVKSIAVLSFKTNQADDQEYLGDGFANAIIDKLNNLDSLLVKASTSTFLYKKKDKTINDIGRELDVGWVLEGNVQKVENKLKVTARLIRVADQSVVFSKQYVGDFGDIFTIQEEISTVVASELKGKLQVNEKAALAKRPTKNQEAYEQYLMGNKCQIRGGKEDLQMAVVYYKRAVALDPQFAEAYIGIASSYLSMGAITDAKNFIADALKINKDLAEAYGFLGQIAFRIDWDFPTAENHFKKAISLNPGTSSPYNSYAQYLRGMGRYNEALRVIEKGRELDPISIYMYGQSMAIYLDLGQYDEVMEFYKKAQEVNPDAPESWYLFQHLGRLYYTTGRYEDALTAFQEKCKIMRIDPIEDQHIGITYGFMGDRKKAEQVVKNLEKRKAFISIAYIYSALGDNNRAFEYMEKAYKNRTPENWNLVMLRADPEFKKIRSDPRYKALLKKVGLPE